MKLYAVRLVFLQDATHFVSTNQCCLVLICAFIRSQRKHKPAPFPAELLLNPQSASPVVDSSGTVYEPHGIVLFDIGSDPYHYTAALFQDAGDKLWVYCFKTCTQICFSLELFLLNLHCYHSFITLNCLFLQDVIRQQYKTGNQSS